MVRAGVCREENTVVYWRIGDHYAFLSAYILAVSWDSFRGIGILFCFSRPIQYRLGLHADQPHESRPITDLLSKTKSKADNIQDTLNNYRNSFTFLANCMVLGLGLAAFTFMKEKEHEFRVIAFCVLVIGCFTSVFFLTQVKEADLSKVCA